MCIADFVGGDAVDNDECGECDDAVVATTQDWPMCGVGSLEASERCDRKLREVVMIFMLAGLMVLNVPCLVSPKYGHVQGGGRSNVASFE